LPAFVALADEPKSSTQQRPPATVEARKVARQFINDFNAGKFEEAAALRYPESKWSAEGLRKFRKVVGSDALHVKELYADDTHGLAFTNAFAYQPAPVYIKQYLMIRLRQKDGRWFVTRFELAGVDGLYVIRKRFLDEYSDAKGAGNDTASAVEQTAGEFLARLSSKELEQATQLCSRSFHETPLQALEDLMREIDAPLKLKTICAAEMSALMTTQTLTLRSAPRIQTQLAIMMQKEEQKWRVDEVQVYDPAGLGEVLKAFLTEHPTAMIR
jgi:hypothetical protein